MRHSFSGKCSCAFCKGVANSLSSEPSRRTVLSNSGTAVPAKKYRVGKDFSSSYGNMGVIPTDLTASANSRVSKNPVGFHAKGGSRLRVNVPEARPDRLTVESFTKII